MKLSVFSVWDDKAQAFLPPFFLPNKAMAVRAFSGCVEDSNHMFCKHKMDYTLFFLGEFDDSTGLVSGEGPEVVIAARAIVGAGFELHSVKEA